MKFLPIKTRVMVPPRDDLYKVLDQYLPRLHEGDILVITSKIVSIHQGRSIKIHKRINKEKLIRSEAEAWTQGIKYQGKEVVLTIKNSTLIPSAGIDESNGSGYYILWPKKPSLEALNIARYLKTKHRIQKFGVIITDSHTLPLRTGVTGIAIGFFGIQPLKDYRGTKDIFGRKLIMTQANLVDSLAGISVMLMGEGAEQTPLLLIRDAKFVQFSNQPTFQKLTIPRKKDIYYPLLKIFKK